jgi:hypothetical protein
VLFSLDTGVPDNKLELGISADGKLQVKIADPNDRTTFDTDVVGGTAIADWSHVAYNIELDANRKDTNVEVFYNGSSDSTNLSIADAWLQGLIGDQAFI